MLAFLKRTFPLRRLFRIAVGIGVALAALGFVFWLGTLGFYDVRYAENMSGPLFRGFLITLRFVAVVIPVGFVAGFLMGWGRTSRSWFVRAFGAAYVELFRGIAPLPLIFFSSITVALMAQNLFYVEEPSAYGLAAGLLALALHSGAYQAEIIRAGILSVPTGQLEAAEALGLTRWQIVFRITLPQAFRVSLPALGNEFASVIKDTSLLSVIGALELSQQGLLLVPSALSVDFNRVFIIWTEIALLYFVITFVVTRTVRAVENVFKVPGLEAAQL